MDLRSPIRRKVEKRGNANIKKKKKKLPRLNDEEKDGGKGGWKKVGISENRKTRPGNKAQHFPQTRAALSARSYRVATMTIVPGQVAQ